MESIPTTFNGIRYRSRLEARWAEFLTVRRVEFEYEPASWKGEYRPDFLLVDFDLYVEVKPGALLHELSIFNDEIILNERAWICVDRKDRATWHIIKDNLHFNDGFRLEIPKPCEIDFQTVNMKGGIEMSQMVLGCPLIFNGL